MASKVLQNIENADLQLSLDEFRSWAKFAAGLVDGIFSPYHQDFFSDPARKYHPYFDHEAEDDTPTLISNSDIERLCDEFETVFDYAKHGEARIDRELVSLDEIESTIGRFLKLGDITWKRVSPYTENPERPASRGPHSWDNGLCVLIGKHTVARYSLDFGRFISLSEIALLANLDERTVYNATLDKNPQSRLILEDSIFSKSAKLVDPANAENWLAGRRNFKRTRTILDQINEQSDVAEDLETSIQNAHFVPVANDASVFHPETCRLPSGFYSVGEKGKEEKFEDYLEALIVLQKMPIPYWRRPNVNNHFGIVKGVGWERKSAEELGLENLSTGLENLTSILEQE